YVLHGYSWDWMGNNYPTTRRAFGVNSKSTFASLKDGSSSTVLVAETLRRVYNGNGTAWGYRGWVMTGHDLAQNHGQAFGINCWTYAGLPETRMVGRLGNWGTTGSQHPGGAQFCMGDA